MHRLLPLFLFLSPAWATQYYVATTGSDSNTGTSASPFLTIFKANSVVVAGDTVNVLPGVYPANLTMCPSTLNNNAVTVTAAGTSGNPIVFQSTVYHGAILDAQMLCHSYFQLHTTTNYITIKNFVIKNAVWAGIGDAGLGNSVISGNDIGFIGNLDDESLSGGHVGILTNSTESNDILDGNFIHDIGRTNSTCGGVTCSPRDQNIYSEGANDIIVNNIVSLSGQSGWGVAVKVGGPSSVGNWIIRYNTFYGAVANGREGQIVIGAGDGSGVSTFDIEDNIFLNGLGPGAIVLCDVALSGTMTISNNLAFGNGTSELFDSGTATCGAGSTGAGGVTQAGNSVADPKLANPAQGQFQLLYTSPAINAGTTYSPASPDYNGTARPTGTAYDYGAIEFLPVSLSITSPTASQSISGFTGFSFQVSTSGLGASAINRVCQTVDAYPAPTDHSNCALSPPWSLNWNTYGVLNGAHQVVATAYDAAGNVLATSAAVSFTVANAWPCSWTPGFTVTPSTSVTSNWSGSVTLTLAVTGASASDNKQLLTFIDGVQTHSTTKTATSTNIVVDTTRWNNGPHVVAAREDDMAATCTTYSDSYEGAIGEWSATVNFANDGIGGDGPVVPMELRENAHEVFLAPAGTFTLTPSLINTDGTTATGITFDYYSQNTAVATVGSATGSTSVLTAVATGNAQIRTMAEVSNGTDLASATGQTHQFSSSSVPATDSMVGQVVNIKTNTGGWVSGPYEIGSVDVNGNKFTTTGTPCPGGATTACTGGSFATGPSRTTWAMVAPTNVLPHFGLDGSLLTAYNPSNSFFLAEAFRSGDLFSDQVYTSQIPNAHANLGTMDDYLALGFNTVEMGTMAANNCSGSVCMNGQNPTTFAANQNTFFTANAALMAPWPNARIFGIMDSITTDAYTWVNPTGTGASPPYVTTTFQDMANAGYVAASLADEVDGKFGFANLQGPVTFASSAAQFGLSSIVAASHTCTVHTLGGFSFGFGGPSAFIIHGATTSGFNSSVGTTFSPSSAGSATGPTTWTFSCPAVADGTYNTSTDGSGCPGTTNCLTIEPYARQGWFGSLYIPYTAWSQWRGWQTAVTGYTATAGSVLGDTQANIPSINNWGPNNTQTLGGVTNVADFADTYYAHSSFENYLGSRASTWTLTTDSANYANSTELAYKARTFYGTGFNSTKPWTAIVTGTPVTFGFQGYTVSSVSCVNDVCTFPGGHKIPVVIPGATRLWILGSSNSAYNTNFVVNYILSPTQLSVSLAATDFNPGCTGNSGTITFQNGDTKAVSTTANSICATGNKSSIGGDSLTYLGSADNNIPKHRGQTFTLAGVNGTGNGTWTTRTFFYSSENLDLAQDGNGSASSVMQYRELPTGTTTGGTATIVADNTFVRGRNGFKVSAANSGGSQTSLLNHPGFGFVNAWEIALLGGAGLRHYQMDWGWQSYNPHAISLSNGGKAKGNWVGLAQSTISKFQDNTVTVNQLTSHPHFETGTAVPQAHAVGEANLFINAHLKYIFQPRLNSPDYGDKIDCSARAGSYGDIMLCVNGTDGPQLRTFSLSPYLQSGQNIVRYVVDQQGIIMSIISAGTTSDTLTLQPNQAVAYVFPASFATELNQPVMRFNLSDIPNAAKIAFRYSYDRYLLDWPTNNVTVCTSTCTLPVNRNIGTVYFRMTYLDSSNNVLATSDVQTM